MRFWQRLMETNAYLHSVGFLWGIQFASNQARCIADGNERLSGLKKEERGLVCVNAPMIAAAPSLEGQVCFCRPKLAVKPATDDPSHTQQSHISPVIWTGWGGGGREKNAITVPFFVCHLCHVWSQRQSSSCYNDAPLTPPPKKNLIKKPHFHSHNRHGCACGIPLTEPHKIVKNTPHYMLLLLILPLF